MKKPFAIILAAVLLGGVVGYAAFSKQPFADVPVGAWYEKAVAWAYECGITNGVDDTHFSPDKPITRAELVTMLYRLNAQAEPTPEPTEKPRTLADCPYLPPQVEQRIVQEFANCYYGRMTIGGIYSVGLYDTMSQALVDESDAAFWMKVKDGCQMVGDHDSEGMWIIRWCGPGDTLEIRKADGEYQKYQWIRTDLHVTNKGADVWDQNGESLFFQLPESGLFICCCNDSEGKDMTATFWRRVG